MPLATAAVKLFAELPRQGDYVLPSAKGSGHYTGLQKDWERVRARAGLEGVRIHDLRHSLAPFAVADGDSLYLTRCWGTNSSRYCRRCWLDGCRMGGRWPANGLPAIRGVPIAHPAALK